MSIYLRSDRNPSRNHSKNNGKESPPSAPKMFEDQFPESAPRNKTQRVPIQGSERYSLMKSYSGLR